MAKSLKSGENAPRDIHYVLGKVYSMKVLIRAEKLHSAHAARDASVDSFVVGEPLIRARWLIENCA